MGFFTEQDGTFKAEMAGASVEIELGMESTSEAVEVAFEEDAQTFDAEVEDDATPFPADFGEVQMVEVPVEGGTTDHAQLQNRDAADQHPISAITGLKKALEEIELTPGPQGPPGRDGNPGKDGLPGKDGVTPHIGANGNWWLGETDTGVAAGGAGGSGGSGATDMFAMSVDADGNLYAHYEDGATKPAFEMDADGNLYYVIEG